MRRLLEDNALGGDVPGKRVSDSDKQKEGIYYMFKDSNGEMPPSRAIVTLLPGDAKAALQSAIAALSFTPSSGSLSAATSSRIS